jgi:hypothetical protein
VVRREEWGRGGEGRGRHGRPDGGAKRGRLTR